MSMIAPNKYEIILNKTKFQIRFFFPFLFLVCTEVQNQNKEFRISAAYKRYIWF